jgi:hypothetical protein
VKKKIGGKFIYFLGKSQELRAFTYAMNVDPTHCSMFIQDCSSLPNLPSKAPTNGQQQQQQQWPPSIAHQLWKPF